MVLAGAGGMGSCYLNALFKNSFPTKIELCGVAEPQPEKSASYAELCGRKIPIFPALKDFYENNASPDLVIIASPVHHHVTQSCLALQQGSHVLCEKPLSATVQDAQTLIHKARSTERWIKIGYQWSFSEAIQRLKKDIIQGRFGRPLRFKTLCLWPRDRYYFQRNDWAGKKKDSDSRWVLDSPANNAMAHFLHNVFYVLGDRPDLSAMPSEVTAELYRAYPIDNYDTVACRAWTKERVEILFYASHSTYEELGPMFSFEFEKGVVSFEKERGRVEARTGDGEELHYGSPEKEPFHKLWDALSAVHSKRPLVCGPEAAYAQTLCMNGIQESVRTIRPFPQAKIKGDTNRIWIDGLTEEFHSCYQRGILPSESDAPWACRGKTVDLQDYGFFPGSSVSEGV